MYSFLISLVVLILGYIFYSRIIEHVFRPSGAPTPAMTKADGVDYVPMPTWKVFMIQFLNIAGTGPIFGAIMGAKFGPSSFLWIVLGSIFAGAVHDYFSGMLSLRHGGYTMPDIIGHYFGKTIRTIMLVFSMVLLLLVGAVFVYSPAQILGDLVPFGSNLSGYLNMDPQSTAIMLWVIIVFLYYIIATLLPIDKIIGKIYPLFAFALLFMAAGLCVCLFIKWPSIPEFWQGLGNTLEYIVLYIPLMLAMSLAAAALLSRQRAGVGAFRVIYYIPVLTSWVAASLIWKSILSPQYGAVNGILGFFGINGPGWLTDEKWAMPAIVLVSVWKDMGFFALILLSGIVGINRSYYEAAELDGAGGWKKFIKITLPLLTPAIFYVLIVSLINSFQLFPQIMIMTDGGPNGATQVMVERIYKYGFRYFEMGYASAFSWILFVIIMLCTALQLRGQKRWVNYDA